MIQIRRTSVMANEHETAVVNSADTFNALLDRVRRAQTAFSGACR